MVDNISKPFNFTSNTYAKASEVNADFDTLYTGVNTCINQVNTNTTNITNLGTSKADKNGSSSNTFSVADPVYGTDAVNKQSMMSAIGNSIDYIGGLKVSKDANQTILVTAGSCYDYDRTVLLKLDSNTTKQDTTLGASANYYVYIIGDDTGTSIDILISSNSSTPSLPAGYTKYRRIARFTTDASKYIDIIYNGGSSTPDATAVIIGSYVSSTSGWILYSNKLCIQWGRLTTSAQGHNKNINLHKTYANTNYNILLQQYGGGNGSAEYQNIQFIEAGSITASKFQIFNGPYSSAIHWRTYGYVA
jgi:hypothetical protein